MTSFLQSSQGMGTWVFVEYGLSYLLSRNDLFLLLLLHEILSILCIACIKKLKDVYTRACTHWNRCCLTRAGVCYLQCRFVCIVLVAQSKGDCYYPCEVQITNVCRCSVCHLLFLNPNLNGWV